MRSGSRWRFEHPIVLSAWLVEMVVGRRNSGRKEALEGDTGSGHDQQQTENYLHTNQQAGESADRIYAGCAGGGGGADAEVRGVDSAEMSVK